MRCAANLADTEENVPKCVFDLGIGHDRFLDLTGRTSLHELCEVIAASDVAVTFDSGVLHVANCTETPVVALFSDNDPRLLHPHPQRQTGRRHVAVHRPCPTQFCQTWHGAWSECIQGGDRRMCCLPTLEQVLDAAAAFLRDTPQS